MKHKRLWFSLAVILQVLILCALITTRLVLLSYGTKVLLEVRPVDPWDIFRGEYVRLSYDISALNLNQIDSAKQSYNRHDIVYVTLEQENKYWVGRSVSSRPPGDESIAIKGKVDYFDEYDNMLYVIYGIESFYLPEGHGRAIEERIDGVDAEVSIDKRGNSAISRLLIDDEEVTFD